MIQKGLEDACPQHITQITLPETNKLFMKENQVKVFARQILCICFAVFIKFILNLDTFYYTTPSEGTNIFTKKSKVFESNFTIYIPKFHPHIVTL